VTLVDGITVNILEGVAFDMLAVDTCVSVGVAVYIILIDMAEDTATNVSVTSK